MRRIKGVIAYDGSAFEGFQRQKRTVNTIQGALERALVTVGINSQVVGSGRTDAKVHATGQVIHFDIPDYWANQSLHKLQTHLNNHLEAIRIKHLSYASKDFHARYDAKERIYRYIFRTDPSIFERKYVAKLDIKDERKLNEALHLFIGKHDFSYFLKSGSNSSHNIRTIYRAYYLRRKEYGYIYFHANGFLRAQVRMMIHAATAVANGTIKIVELKKQLETKERFCIQLAPPQGLYQARVIY